MKKYTVALGTALALLFPVTALALVTDPVQVPAQIKARAQALSDRNPPPRHLPPEVLKAYAGALGMDVQTLTAELNSKKTLNQLIKSKSLTKKQFRLQVANQLQEMITSGELKGSKAKFYSESIAWSKTSANK